MLFHITDISAAAKSPASTGQDHRFDLFRLFRDLNAREANHLDNGQVDGHVSIADKSKFGQALIFFGIAYVIMIALIPWSRVI